MSVVKFYILAHSHLTLAIFLVAMHNFVISSYICYFKIPLFSGLIKLKSRTASFMLMPQIWLRCFFHYWEESSWSSSADWLFIQEGNIFYDQ